jgi:hypothetical protein
MSHLVELVGSWGKDTLRPDLVKDAEEKRQVIRENLKMAQMRQKSYHDKGTAPRHLEVGDCVYLKVPPPKVCKGSVLKGN